MKTIDQAVYNDWKNKNSDDPYGRAIFAYAEVWADLMEAEIANSPGMNVADVLKARAKLLSYEADTDGITGFMYGAAVATLAKCWVHGEELRRWHNLDIALGSEGAKANEKGTVLNPALLTVEKVVH